jgi:hypothetical protein
VQLRVLHTWRAHLGVGSEASGHSPGQQERVPPRTPTQAVDFVRERQSEHDRRKLDHGNTAGITQQLDGLGLLCVPPGEIHPVPQLGKALHLVVFVFPQCFQAEKAERSHQSSRQLLEAFGAFREQRIADDAEQVELLHHLLSAKVGREIRIDARSHVGHLPVALVQAIDEFDDFQDLRFTELDFPALHEHILVEHIAE